MIEETAHVLRSEGEFAWVETRRRSSCGGCAAKQNCGTGALSQVVGAKVQQMKVRNPIAAQPGDEVVLGIEEGVFLKGSLAVYLVPLLAMIFSGLLGHWLAEQWLLNDDRLGLIFGIGGFIAGLLWLKRYNLRASGDPRFMAEILRLNQTVIHPGIEPLSKKRECR